MISYRNHAGDLIEEYGDGAIFINGVCVAEPGSDRDFDRYATEVMNGYGYYDTEGKFHYYPDD